MINIIGYILFLYAVYDIIKTVEICFDIKRIVGFKIKDLMLPQIQKIILGMTADFLALIFIFYKL